jgi:hypothetical protein
MDILYGIQSEFDRNPSGPCRLYWLFSTAHANQGNGIGRDCMLPWQEA